MLSALRHAALFMAMGTCSLFMINANASLPGDIANQQTRYIATMFPGRMIGSPAEMLIADYLQHRFHKLGYHSDIRQFDTRYIYTDKEGHKNWHRISGNSVIAAREGKMPQQIIIVAHLDTYLPLSDKDVDNNLGGLTLQGVDDNASGLGVMLELAERMKNIPTCYGIRFIATSGEEPGMSGAEKVIERMSAKEKKNTLLVINLSNLIIGQKLYFTSGKSTPAAVRRLTRDRALSIAHRLGIPAGIGKMLNEKTAHNDSEYFDRAGIPVLSVSATDHLAADNKTNVSSKHRHNVKIDNQHYLDEKLPGRIKKRSREAVQIMLPLVKELAKAGK